GRGGGRTGHAVGGAARHPGGGADRARGRDRARARRQPRRQQAPPARPGPGERGRRARRLLHRAPLRPARAAQQPAARAAGADGGGRTGAGDRRRAHRRRRVMTSAEVRWIAFEAVARIYRVDVEWLLRAEDLGVLPNVERRAGTALLPADDLDRVAAAVRWHRHFGVDLDVIAALLSEVPRR